MTQAPDVYGDDELAALYDLNYADYDADLVLYESFAVRGELPSLELCAGSGRVLLHLAHNGHRVTGIDASLPMLARCEASLDRETAKLVRLVEADMRDFELGEKFDLVYCALDSFEQMLNDDDALAALRCAAKHLAKGGAFVTELRTLASVDWSAGARPALLEWTRTEPGSGDAITKWSSTRASAAAQTTTTSLVFDRTPRGGGPVRRRAFDVTLRVFGRREFEALLRAAGFGNLQWYGGTDLSPLSDDSDTMVIVAGGL